MPPKLSGEKRCLFIAGNWKMNKTLDEAKALAEEIARGVPNSEKVQVALFPPAVALRAVVEAVRQAEASTAQGGSLSKEKPILVGAQNVFFEKSGAYTGEISAPMVRSAGGQAVLVGHSERRQIFGEKDDWAARKVLAVLQEGLLPVLCVGETLGEREEGRTFEIVRGQLAAVMGFLEAKLAGRGGCPSERSKAAPSDSDPLPAETRESVRAGVRSMIIAYEPVWAIGTGKTATPQQGQEVQEFIRAELRGAFARLGLPESAAEATRILYGGSVNAKNAKDLLAEPDIDGLLVGGASLEAASFLSICSAGL